MLHLPYVYRLTDKVNGLRYIGSRFAKGCFPEDLGVRYFTSSEIVNPIFKADPDRFEKQILVIGTVDYVRAVEHSLLKFYDARVSDEFYNLTDNEAASYRDCVAGGKAMAERTSIRMKLNHPMHDPVKAKNHSEWMKENNPSKRLDVKEKMSSSSKGRAKSEFHKLKIKESGCGQKGAALNFTGKIKCLECGLVSTPGPIACHQKAVNHVGLLKMENI